MQGLKQVIRAQAPTMVVRPIVFVLGILTLRYAFERPVTAPVAILLQLAATTVALLADDSVSASRHAETRASGQ